MLFNLLVSFVLAGAWLGLITAGAVIVWRGAAGRLVDRHPRCRRCRYDLTGPRVRPTRCPECGTDLYSVTAVVLGRYVADRRRIALGVGLLLLGASPAVGFLPASGRGAAPAPARARRAAAAPPSPAPPALAMVASAASVSASPAANSAAGGAALPVAPPSWRSPLALPPPSIDTAPEPALAPPGYLVRPPTIAPDPPFPVPSPPAPPAPGRVLSPFASTTASFDPRVTSFGRGGGGLTTFGAPPVPAAPFGAVGPGPALPLDLRIRPVSIGGVAIGHGPNLLSPPAFAARLPSRLRPVPSPFTGRISSGGD